MTTPTSGQSLKQSLRVPLLLVSLAALTLFPLVSPPLYYVSLLINFLLLAILASSWNIVGGYAGYMSLGNSFAFGMGGYAGAVLLRNLGISPFISAPFVGLVAALVGLGIGALTLRVKGPAFFIVTLSLVIVANVAAGNWMAIGGMNGLVLPILNLPLSLYYLPFYYAHLIILVVTLIASYQIKRSKFGLGLMAIREDEARAASMGINTLRYKCVAFAFSLMFMGMIGVIDAYLTTIVYPDDMFTVSNDIGIILMTLLGGRGTLLGPVLGAAVFIPLTEFFNTYLGSNELNGVALGILIIIVVKFKPDGILGPRPLQIGRWTIRLRREITPRIPTMGGVGSVGGITNASVPEFSVDSSQRKVSAQGKQHRTLRSASGKQ